jgi:hypothetical protein
VPDLPWPLRHIVDEDGRDTGYCFVRGPLDSFGGNDEYAALREDHRMLGLTSMGPYPLYHEAYGRVPPGAAPNDGWRRPFVAACEGWAHCFRDPETYLPPGVPRALISESDFVDPDRTWRLASEGGRPAKRWDLLYSCLGNRFNEIQKNWDLAKECLGRLSDFPSLRVLLVGRIGTADLVDLPGVDTCGYIPWSQFLQCLVRSRAAFFPNALDSSPRVISEAISLDVPVVVNERILGGWKYIAPETGVFFRDEADAVAAITTVLTGSYEPKAWYAANYGPQQSGQRLAGFLREVAAATGAPEPSCTWARFSAKV